MSDQTNKTPLNAARQRLQNRFYFRSPISSVMPTLYNLTTACIAGTFAQKRRSYNASMSESSSPSPADKRPFTWHLVTPEDRIPDGSLEIDDDYDDDDEPDSDYDEELVIETAQVARYVKDPVRMVKICRIKAHSAPDLSRPTWDVTHEQRLSVPELAMRKQKKMIVPKREQYFQNDKNLRWTGLTMSKPLCWQAHSGNINGTEPNTEQLICFS